MQDKVISGLLLILLLSVSVISQPLFTKGHSDESNQESSPEEERQARNLAVKVIKRLQLTNDFTPLLREFFIRDFVIHAKYFLLDATVNDPDFAESGIDRRVLAIATNGDYRHAYVASMSAWHHYNQLQEATDEYVAARNNVEGGEIYGAQYQKLRETARDEALTPLFFSIANANPTVSLLVPNLITGVEDADRVGYNARLKTARIRTLKGLRVFITALTKCVDLMRKAVGKLRADRDGLNVGRAVQFKSDDESTHVYKYWTETTEKRQYGFSAGTKLIYARIYPWELVMTRRNGRLKVVTMYPDFDGD